jgi:hypothetical protein
VRSAWGPGWAGAIVFALLLADPPAFAESAPEVASLEGLGGVGLVVEHPPRAMRAMGLGRGAVRRGVEARLRARGVPVLEDASVVAGGPSLHVRVRLIEAEGGLLYSGGLLLFQGVSLAGPDAGSARAVTWEAEAMGFSARSSRYDLENAVLGITNAFADDFRSANPGG